MKEREIQDNPEELNFEFLDSFKELETSDKFMLIIGVFMVVLVCLIGGILVNGIIFGFLAAIGVDFLLLYSKDDFPKLWNWMLDHKAPTDIGLSILFIFLLNPGTAIGIIGGVSAGIFTSISLLFFRKVVGKVEIVNKIHDNKDFNNMAINNKEAA